MPSTPNKSAIPSALLPDHFSQSGGLESEDLSFRQALRILRKRQSFILLIAGSVLLLAVLISVFIPARYGATSTIELLAQSSDPLSGQLGEVASSLTGQSDLKTDLATATAILQDQQVGVEVLERLNVEDRVYSAGLAPWNRNKIPDKAHRRPLNEDPVAREFLLKNFESSLGVQQIPESRLLQLTYTSGDPKFSAAVTNAVVDQYIKDVLGRRNISTVQASEWMGTQLDDLRKKVEVDQQELANYQKKSGFIVVPGMSSSGGGLSSGGAGSSSSGGTLHSTLLDRLLALNQTLVQAQAARITEEAIYRVVQTQDPNAIAALATSLSANSSNSGQAALLSGLLALRQQQTALKQQLASSFNVYGAKNPHVTELNQQITFLDVEMRQEVGRILATAGSDLKIAQESETGVRKEVADLEKEANGINDSAVRLAVLQQEADSSRALYEDLYTKLEEAKLAEETQSSNVSVISDALPSSKAQWPNWPVNLAVGLVGGLVLGVVFAFIRENLDDTLITSLEVEQLTGLPILGSIPQFELSSGTRSRRSAAEVAAPAMAAGGWLVAEPRSQPAEAYRTLRTTLLLSQSGGPPRTLLVTSSLPSEGKTTTTYNLAVCFAMLGKRVLAIDADLRRPALHTHIRSSNRSGLSTLLTSAASAEEVIIQDPMVPTLSIITAGPTPPNPTELLGSKTFADMLSGFSEQYDLVIIDSPPTMVVTDAVIMSAMVDGTVVVVRSGMSTRSTLLRVTENLRRNKAKLLGFVLNRVDTKSADYYYTYGYYGTDYYGEAPNDKDKS